ncbi:hypothetical protein HK097_005273, partial [Rhizophlyctis rosea]
LLGGRGGRTWGGGPEDGGDGEGEGGAFLGRREVEEYQRKWKMDEDVGMMEISKFMYWQTDELPVLGSGLKRSGRTKRFVECVRKMEGLAVDEVTGGESTYGEEMRKLLDEELVGVVEDGEGQEEGVAKKKRKRSSVGGKSKRVSNASDDVMADVPGSPKEPAAESVKKENHLPKLGYKSPLARMFGGQKKRGITFGSTDTGRGELFDDEVWNDGMNDGDDYMYEDPFLVYEPDLVFEEDALADGDGDDVAPLPPPLTVGEDVDVRVEEAAVAGAEKDQDDVPALPPPLIVSDDADARVLPDVEHALSPARMNNAAVQPLGKAMAMDVDEVAGVGEDAFAPNEVEANEDVFDDEFDDYDEWGPLNSTQLLANVDELEAAALEATSGVAEDIEDIENLEEIPESPILRPRSQNDVDGFGGDSMILENELEVGMDEDFFVPETPVKKRVLRESPEGNGVEMCLDGSSPTLGKRKESPLKLVAEVEKRARVSLDGVSDEKEAEATGGRAVGLVRQGLGIKPWQRGAGGLGTNLQRPLISRNVGAASSTISTVPPPPVHVGPFTKGGCFAGPPVAKPAAITSLDDDNFGFDGEDEVLVDELIADMDESMFTVPEVQGLRPDVKGKGPELSTTGTDISASESVKVGRVDTHSAASPFRVPVGRPSRSFGVSPSGGKNVGSSDSNGDTWRKDNHIHVEEEPSPDLTQPIRMAGRRRAVIVETPDKTMSPLPVVNSVEASPSVKKFKRLRKKMIGDEDEESAESGGSKKRGRKKRKPLDPAARLERLRQKRKDLESNPFIDHEAEVSSGSDNNVSEDELSEEDTDLVGFVVTDSQGTPAKPNAKSPGTLLAFYGKSLMSPEFGGMGNRRSDALARKWGLHVTPSRKKRRWAEEREGN